MENALNSEPIQSNFTTRDTNYLFAQHQQNYEGNWWQQLDVSNLAITKITESAAGRQCFRAEQYSTKCLDAAGWVVCLDWGANDLHVDSWCHCHPIICVSIKSKIFILLVLAYPGCLGKRSLNKCSSSRNTQHQIQCQEYITFNTVLSLRQLRHILCIL